MHIDKISIFSIHINALIHAEALILCIIISTASKSEIAASFSTIKDAVETRII